LRANPSYLPNVLYIESHSK